MAVISDVHQMCELWQWCHVVLLVLLVSSPLYLQCPVSLGLVVFSIVSLAMTLKGKLHSVVIYSSQ